MNEEQYETIYKWAGRIDKFADKAVESLDKLADIYIATEGHVHAGAQFLHEWAENVRREADKAAVAPETNTVEDEAGINNEAGTDEKLFKPIQDEIHKSNTNIDDLLKRLFDEK